MVRSAPGRELLWLAAGWPCSLPGSSRDLFVPRSLPTLRLQPRCPHVQDWAPGLGEGSRSPPLSPSASQPAPSGCSPGPPLSAGRQPHALRLHPAANAVRDDHQVSLRAPHSSLASPRHQVVSVGGPLGDLPPMHAQVGFPRVFPALNMQVTPVV